MPGLLQLCLSQTSSAIFQCRTWTHQTRRSRSAFSQHGYRICCRVLPSIEASPARLHTCTAQQTLFHQTEAQRSHLAFSHRGRRMVIAHTGTTRNEHLRTWYNVKRFNQHSLASPSSPWQGHMSTLLLHIKADSIRAAEIFWQKYGAQPYTETARGHAKNLIKGA